MEGIKKNVWKQSGSILEKYLFFCCLGEYCISCTMSLPQSFGLNLKHNLSNWLEFFIFAGMPPEIMSNKVALVQVSFTKCH